MSLGHLGDFGGQFRPGAVGQSPRLHIGAGDVHLDQVHPGLGQLFTHDAVFLGGVPRDVGDHLHVILPQEGELRLHKGVHPRVLEAHRVENAHGSLCDSGARVALPAVEGQALGADGTQFAQVIERPVLPAEAEGPRGHAHRVFQSHPSQLHPHIHIRHPNPPPWRQRRVRPCTHVSGCRPPCRRHRPGRRLRRSPSAPP